MNYQCPNRNCNVSWNIDEDLFQGGTIFNCNRCKTASRIPLYCPRCNPKTVPDKVYLQTPDGDLAGQVFTCPKCSHNFHVLVFNDDVHARLQSLGHEVGQYHQGVRSAGMRDAQLRQTVSAGYCAGVILDWLRGVLQGGGASFANAEAMLNSDTPNPLLDKQLRQDKRAATAWTEQTRAKQDAGVQTAKAAELAKLKMAPPAAKPQALKDYQAFMAQPAMAQFWPHFSSTMDQYVAKERTELGRDPSRRPFSKLKVTSASNMKIYEGGVAAVIDDVVARMAATQGAAIGIQPPDGSSGHAVGIHRLNTGNYHFFDPNFGVYVLDEDKLREAFIYLFITAYPLLTGNTSDNHPYEVNGRTMGEFTIFAGSPAPPKVVQQQRRPSTGPTNIAAVVLAPMNPTTPVVLPATNPTPTGRPRAQATVTRPANLPRPGTTPGQGGP